MIEGMTEMVERRRRRCKQLLDDFKYKKIFWKMNEETLDRTLGRIDFGRGLGPK
jgi:ribosome biogenesis protein Tsr3